MERIFSGWTIGTGSRAFSGPTLIAAGRRDSVAGFADATRLLEQYSRAALAVIDDAGHALMHERPGLVAALLGDWLDRSRSVTRDSRAATPASLRHAPTR